jgi:phage gp29-like protein
MDSQLKNEIAGISKDIFNPPFGVNLRPHDDTLLTRGGGKGLKLYDEIERDPHAFAVLQKRKMSVIAYPWEVEAASSSRADKKAADFIKDNFNAINFDKVTLYLLDANLKGYAVGEIMWGTDGSQIVVERIMPRDQRRFAFDYDYKLRLLTWQNMWPGEEMPDKKFIVHSTGAKDGSPYGLGLGTRLFWPVWFKKQSIQFWLTFADKYGSPTAIGRYPAGTSASDQDNLLNALGAIAQESAIAVPDNMTVELLEAARSSAGDFYERMCKYMDDQMSVAVLGENSTTSGKSSGMNSNQAQVHNEVRLELSKADADLLSGTLSNTIVKWLTEFNFPGATPPRVWRRIAQQEDLKSRAERDVMIFDLGFKPTLDYITETYGDGWEVRDIPTAAIQIPAGDSNQAAPAFAEAGDKPYTDDLLANQLAIEGAKPFADTLVKIKAIVDSATSLENLRDALIGAFGDLPQDELVKVMQAGFAVAELAGMADVADGQ